MGCDGSKVENVLEPKRKDSEVSVDFTEQETDTIRSTWPILADDIETTGVKVFLRLFYEEPKVKEVFSRFGYVKVKEVFSRPGSMEEIDLMKSEAFKEHAVKFMKVVDEVVDNMDQPKTKIQQTLMMLGAKHATFHGFRVEYFHAYSKSLIDVWEYTIGEEFIPEVRECWSDFFDYLVKYMCQGYDIFVNESDVNCNGNSSKILN